MTLASIVVPSRGGLSRLPTLLRSAERQDHKDLEVIVVVDGDVDGTQRMLSQGRWGVELHVIVFPENRGRSAALNAGFHAARGEVLIRADDDLEFEDSFVSLHVRHHVGPAVGVIGKCVDIFPDTTYARVYGRSADKAIRAAARAAAPDRRWIYWGGNVSTTAETYERVGDYDSAFRRYGWEDVDWGYRLHRLGLPIVVPPEFATLHHGPVTSVRERARRALHSGASRASFVDKHGPDALPDSTPGTTPWDRVVSLASAVATERTISFAAGALDRVVHYMPERIGEKQIALTIQAAAMAGRRHPERARASF